MKKFRVIIQIWDHLEIEVAAESQNEAVRMVEENISNYDGTDGVYIDGGRDIEDIEEID